MKIEVVNPWVNDLTQENLDTNWITEAYGRGLVPEIMFKAADSNSAPIYIAENTLWVFVNSAKLTHMD